MSYLTIPGFESLTRQEIFDLGLAHIRKTRTKGMRTVPGRDKGADGTRQICSYQGSGCVASVLLREEARKDADTHGNWEVVVSAGIAPATHRDFIVNLQEVHDDCPAINFMENFEDRMREFADNNNLKYEPEVPA